MPKIKMKKSASKRSTARPGGMIKRNQALKCYILIKEATRDERYLRGTEGVHETNLKSVRAAMPYAQP